MEAVLWDTHNPFSKDIVLNGIFLFHTVLRDFGLLFLISAGLQPTYFLGSFFSSSYFFLVSEQVWEYLKSHLKLVLKLKIIGVDLPLLFAISFVI